MITKRILAALPIALTLVGCASTDVFTGQITQAQAEYLKSRAAIAASEAESTRHIVDTLAALTEGDDPTVRVVGLLMLDRMAARHSPAYSPTTGRTAPQQDGPIASVVKAALPLVLPLAQLWQTDRAGKRSLEQSIANMGLIKDLAGSIPRDPLVVTTPEQRVVQVPELHVVDRPVPHVIEPFVLEPSVIQGGGM